MGKHARQRAGFHRCLALLDLLGQVRQCTLQHLVQINRNNGGASNVAGVGKRENIVNEPSHPADRAGNKSNNLVALVANKSWATVFTELSGERRSCEAVYAN